MQRILSNVWLSILAGSAALSLAACDPANESIDEFADLEGDDPEAEDEADARHSVDFIDDRAPPHGRLPRKLSRETAFTPPHEPTQLPLGTPPEEPSCACADDWDPQCGVDLETYENECAAACAGVEIKHEGACECLCTLEWDPVCADDGQTYGNACAAGCAGVDVVYEGVCLGAPCDADSDCAAGNQFCQRDAACDGPGVCEIRADSCPDKPAAVCGCDGQTYESACMAHVSGVSVASEEPCELVVEPSPEF